MKQPTKCNLNEVNKFNARIRNWKITEYVSSVFVALGILITMMGADTLGNNPHHLSTVLIMTVILLGVNVFLLGVILLIESHEKVKMYTGRVSSQY